MTSEGADKIIAKVEGLVSEAVSKLEFKSGDRQTTQVLPGFPFSLIKEIPQETGSYEREEVAPWFPEGRGYYSTGTSSGSQLFFLPFDPATKVGGTRCYDTPRPYVNIPNDQIRVIYLEQTFQVSSWEKPSPDDYDPNIPDEPIYVLDSVTAGSATIYAARVEDIPSSTYPQSEGLHRYELLYPGTYTYYFYLGAFKGVADRPVELVDTELSEDFWTEYEEKNEGVQYLLGATPGGFLTAHPFLALFPYFFGRLKQGIGNSSGDVAAEGGWFATTLLEPTP